MRRRSSESDRTWLAIAASLGIAAVTLLFASEGCRWTDPVFYVGIACGGLALYLATAALLFDLPLPPLRSERAHASFQAESTDLLVEGQALYNRLVSSDGELTTLKADYEAWVNRARGWLEREVSKAAADAFAKPTGMAADVLGSYNGEHSGLRLTLSWQLDILRNSSGRRP